MVGLLPPTLLRSGPLLMDSEFEEQPHNGQQPPPPPPPPRVSVVSHVIYNAAAEEGEFVCRWFADTHATPFRPGPSLTFRNSPTNSVNQFRGLPASPSTYLATWRDHSSAVLFSSIDNAALPRRRSTWIGLLPHNHAPALRPVIN